MAKVRIIGTYQPDRTPFHNVDAKAKIVSALCIAIAAALAHSFIGFAVVAALVIAAMIAAQVKPMQLAPMVRPFGIMLAVLALLFAFIPSPSFARLGTGILLAVRIALVAAYVLVIDATTTPTQLVDAFVKLLGPLGKIGLPLGSAAMACTNALRLIPVAEDERARILAAQAASGARLGEGGIKAAFANFTGYASALVHGIAAHGRAAKAAMVRRGYSAERVAAVTHPLRVSGWLLIVAGIAAIVVAVIL